MKKPRTSEEAMARSFEEGKKIELSDSKSEAYYRRQTSLKFFELSCKLYKEENNIEGSDFDISKLILNKMEGSNNE